MAGIAVARARAANGARVFVFLGLLQLGMVPITWMDGGNVRSVLLTAGFAVGTIFVARLTRRGHWVASLIGTLAFLGSLSLALFAGLGFVELAAGLVAATLMVLGTIGAFRLTRAEPAARREPIPRPVRLSRGGIVALGLGAGGALASLLGLLVVTRRIWRPFGFTIYETVGDQFLFDLVGFALLAAGGWLFSLRRRRLALSAAQARAADNRPPILLLRSFGDDHIPVLREYRLTLFEVRSPTFEEALTEDLWSQGPVIAIGRPGEILPPLGAAREYLRNEEWQGRVSELAHGAQRVVLVIGSTEGVVWELSTLIAAGLLPRTTLVLPPVSRPELSRRWSNVARALGDACRIEDEALGRTLLVTFGADCDPVCWTAPRRRAHFYREAVRWALATSVSGSPPSTAAAP